MIELCGRRVERNLPLDAQASQAAVETVEPKTKAGRREVPLAPPAREALLEWKASTSEPRTLNGYVWQAEDGGPFARTSVMKRARAPWKAAELQEIGLHEARHSAASMWIASDWSVKVVARSRVRSRSRSGRAPCRRPTVRIHVQRQFSGDLGALALRASELDGPAQSLDAVPQPRQP